MVGKHGPRRPSSPKILNQACSFDRLQWPRVIRRQIHCNCLSSAETNREVSHTASYATFSRRFLDQKYQPAPKLGLMPLPLVPLGLKVDHVNLAPGMTGLIALIQVCRVYETDAIAF